MTVKLGGSLQYRCRYCGVTYSLGLAPDLVEALICLTVEGTTPSKWGVTVGMTEMHYCGPDRRGIADVVGGTLDVAEEGKGVT